MIHSMRRVVNEREDRITQKLIQLCPYQMSCDTHHQTCPRHLPSEFSSQVYKNEVKSFPSYRADKFGVRKNRQTDRKTDRHRDEQTDRETETDRQTDRQTDAGNDNDPSASRCWGNNHHFNWNNKKRKFRSHGKYEYAFWLAPLYLYMSLLLSWKLNQ